MAYDNRTPVSSEELLDKYGVVLTDKEDVGWVKKLSFVAEDGVPYKCALYWDIWDGYEIVWVGVPPKDLMDLADRPEFEYIVDSITDRFPYAD